MIPRIVLIAYGIVSFCFGSWIIYEWLSGKIG